MYSKLITGRAARPLAAATAAALLMGIAISGCGHSGGGAALPVSPGGVATPASAGTTATGPAPSASTAGALAQPSGSGPCYQWSGVSNLREVELPLRQMADDIAIYGPGSDQANSDGMALSITQGGLSQIVLTQLPYDWAMRIQNQVLSVGPGATADQLTTAAVSADEIANEISQMCYIP